MANHRGAEADEVLDAIKAAIAAAQSKRNGGSSRSTGSGYDSDNVDPRNGSGRIPTTNLYDLLGRNAGNTSALNETSFADFLNAFVGSGDLSPDVLNAFIQAMMQYGATVDQRAYDYSLTKDQRKYDWQLLQDQRLYDNATNQLARLMGAGISRDQAIQLLSGSPSASAIGASSPVAGAAPSMASPNIPSSTDVANSVFSAISAFSGLVSLGFSIPQAFQQVKFMKNQNFLNGEQIKAYQLSSQAYNIIKSSGLEIADDVFSSVGNVGNFLTSLADNGNTAAQQFISSGGVDGLRSTSPYSSPMLAQLYKDERSARDYNEEFRNNMDLIRAQADLQKVNTDHLRTDILQIEQNIQNLRASEQYTIAQTNLAKKTEELTGKQIELTGAQVLTENETLYSLSMQNDLEESWRTSVANDGRTGLQLYSDYRLQQLYGDVMQLTTLNSKEAWNKHASSIIANYENSIALYELGTLYANGEIDVIIDSDQQTLDLLNFCRAADKSGLFNYVQSIANSETAGSWNTQFGGSSYESKGAVEVLNGIEKRFKRKNHRR